MAYESRVLIVRIVGSVVSNDASVHFAKRLMLGEESVFSASFQAFFTSRGDCLFRELVASFRDSFRFRSGISRREVQLSMGHVR